MRSDLYHWMFYPYMEEKLRQNVESWTIHSLTGAQKDKFCFSMCEFYFCKYAEKFSL